MGAESAREQWRGLEQLAADPALQRYLQDEFPEDAAVWSSPVTRRRFLALAAASLGLAGLTGCSVKPPSEQILPYVRQPAGLVPGKPLFYATTMTLGGYGYGLLVKSR